MGLLAGDESNEWLVSLDEIGWDNPIYKMTNHPRHVIEED